MSFPSVQTNCNMICGPEYTAETKRSMAQINEKETSFELVEALLKYIETLQVVGAVLIFLPGWNLIYSMQRHLETNPHFGTSSPHLTHTAEREHDTVGLERNNKTFI